MNYKQRKIHKEIKKIQAEHSYELLEKYPTVKGEIVSFGTQVLCSINDCDDTEKFLNELKSIRQYKIEATKALKERGII